MIRKTIKLCEFNVENLFISMDFYSGQSLERLPEQGWRQLALAQLQKKQKPLKKLWGLAKAILDIDPDILLLIEVGGRDSLENFNRYFLEDRFNAVFLEGNSKRSIDLGFLVKKDLCFRVETRSNRDVPVEVSTLQGNYTARFSRDVAELRLFDSENRPRLIVLLTHLKSKISTDVDFKGKDVRTAEAFALAEIYERLRASDPEIPIIVAGDFNADLSSLELEMIRHTDLLDFHDLLNTSLEDRISLVHFESSGKPQPMVLDYILISPHLKDRIVVEESYTYRYKGYYDIPEELPKSMPERLQMPSDHYPVVLTVRV